MDSCRDEADIPFAKDFPLQVMMDGFDWCSSKSDLGGSYRIKDVRVTINETKMEIWVSPSLIEVDKRREGQY
jgi:hypothetical protein